MNGKITVTRHNTETETKYYIEWQNGVKYETDLAEVNSITRNMNLDNTEINQYVNGNSKVIYTYN